MSKLGTKKCFIWVFCNWNLKKILLYLKSGICGPKFRHFYFFQEILQLDKFVGAGFKYDNGFFFKFQSNKTKFRISNMTIVFSNHSSKIRKLGIFVPRFKDLYFSPNFVIKQIWGRYFQIWQWLFRIPARKYPNKTK